VFTTPLRTTHEEQVASAVALGHGGQFTAAEEALRRLQLSNPQSPKAAYELGALLRRIGRYGAAEPLLRRALELDPLNPAHRHAMANILLCLGRYEEAWRYYDARHDIPALNNPRPRLRFPEWRGEDPAGKRLVVLPEQGLGDQIQAARFAPQLTALGAEVTWICAPPLARLFQEGLGVTVLAAEGRTRFPDPDYWTTSGALAARLNVTLSSIPQAPYLRAGAPTGSQRRAVRVGLTTRGNPNHANDAERSLTDADAAALRGLPVEIVDLSPAATGARDFADTAGIMADLDLVISVDTSVAHLAGALGRPCWVLLPAIGTDWRWLADRDDSPWYPSIRLYRRMLGDDWSTVVSRLVSDARAFTAEAASQLRGP